MWGHSIYVDKNRGRGSVESICWQKKDHLYRGRVSASQHDHFLEPISISSEIYDLPDLNDKWPQIPPRTSYENHLKNTLQILAHFVKLEPAVKATTEFQLSEIFLIAS